MAGQTYLAQISGAFDYFGFNTYQTSPAGLQAVMGSAGGGVIAGGGLSYGAPGIADQIKPLLLTEIGWAHSGVTAGVADAGSEAGFTHAGVAAFASEELA